MLVKEIQDSEEKIFLSKSCIWRKHCRRPLSTQSLEIALIESYMLRFMRELEGFRVAQIRSLTKLNLVDLSGNKMIRDRLRSGIVGNTDHRSGRSFSRMLRETRPDIDGILYPSRLIHDKVCIAIYDHAVQKLDAENGETLNQDRRMPGIMSD